uniref:Ricin B lectin domain-containing protein n=1 Tax=Pseudictyota dubia TaxID=2749911 RepID=A0A7R9ZAY6_9STRA
MSNGKACSANSDCWSGHCDGYGSGLHDLFPLWGCAGRCVGDDFVFDPSSNLVSYHDYNSCGPRGDDAQADLGQCQYGYRVVGAEKNDNYAVKARVNGCDYFAYTAYECLTTEDWSDTLSDGLCYNFRNRATGRILDAYTSGDVHAHAFNGGNYQKWYAEMSGNNYMFKNKATGRYLDSNTAGDVYTGVYNGGKYQEWVVSVTPCS